MPTEETTNAGTTQSNENSSNTTGSTGQTGSIETKYAELMGAISNGEYVPKKVYVGLQQTHEAEVNAKKQLATELADAKTKLESYQTQVAQLTTEKTAAETGLKETKTRLERQKMVMSQYPELAKWEADGLLPDAPLEKLPELLKTISARVKETQTQAKTDAIAGASPLGSSSQDVSIADKAKAKFSEASAALMAGDTKSYEKLFAEYLTLKGDGKPK